jgi:hypothetical protein
MAPKVRVGTIGFTVKVAAALVTVPATLVTTTVYAELPSVVVGGVVYELDVAPLMGAPPRYH